MAVFRNVTSNWNGWYKELKGGFYMVQDFILFLEVFRTGKMPVGVSIIMRRQPPIKQMFKR